MYIFKPLGWKEVTKNLIGIGHEYWFISTGMAQWQFGFLLYSDLGHNIQT